MDEIGAFTRAYGEAVYAKDPGRLASLYDTDIRVFDAWGQRPMERLAAWRASLDQWLQSLSDEERVQVSFNDVEILRRGEMACLHARVTYAAVNTKDEVLRSMQNRLSWVLTWSPRGWAIVHEHTSVPIGPDLQGILHPQ